MFAHMPIIRDIIYGAVRHGASLEQLCSKLNISLQDLNDSSKYVDFEKAYKVWEHSVRMTNDPLLGLHVGEKTNPSILGLVGHLLQSSSTLKQAFEKVCEHNPVVTDIFMYRIKETSQQVMLVYEPIDTWMKVSPETARQAVDQAMSGTLNVFELLSGKKIYPEKALFAIRKPSMVKEYDRVFKCALSFQATTNALVFNSEQLAQPILSYDQSLFALFDEILNEKKSQLTQQRSFVEEVSNIVTAEFKGIIPPLEIMASRFMITPRTFQRRLKEEGSSYREVSNQIKKQLAMRWLKNHSKKVEEIATLLGYSELSSFQRAFKSWSDTTPGKMRKSA